MNLTITVLVSGRTERNGQNSQRNETAKIAERNGSHKQTVLVSGTKRPRPDRDHSFAIISDYSRSILITQSCLRSTKLTTLPSIDRR